MCRSVRNANRVLIRGGLLLALWVVNSWTPILALPTGPSQGIDPHAGEPAVLRLYEVATILTNYRTAVSKDFTVAPLPIATAAILERTPLRFKYVNASSFSREFVPPPGITSAPGARVYRLDDTFLCIFELAADRRSYKILVVNWVGPPGNPHYVVWRNALSDGNEEGTFEGHILGLDSRTTGEGTRYADRIYRR